MILSGTSFSPLMLNVPRVTELNVLSENQFKSFEMSHKYSYLWTHYHATKCGKPLDFYFKKITQFLLIFLLLLSYCLVLTDIMCQMLQKRFPKKIVQLNLSKTKPVL